MNIISETYQLLYQGGWVTIPLLLVSALLCYTTSYRWLALQRGYRGHIRALLRELQESPRADHSGLLPDLAQKMLSSLSLEPKVRRRHLDEVIADVHSDLGRYRQVLRTLVMIAPLMGLLGTVIGMIETFSSLGDMSLYTQTGGIAGGISQALITTQMGLVIAVPGLFFDRFLSGREDKIRDEILQMKEVVCQQN